MPELAVAPSVPITATRRARWLTPVEAGAGIVVALVAVAARLYELRDVPRLTDETDEVMRGLQIARGELLPLTNIDAYIGPLWSYLLALGFVIFGPSSALPRTLTVLVSLATVAAAWSLGSELARRLGRPEHAALMGGGTALLLAASSFHAIVGARLAWSHCLTPLFLTVTITLLLRWERCPSDKWLVGAGLAYGLAVHTHPTAIAFAPGLLVWALIHWRRVLTSRAGWLALAVGLLANAPMLAYNLSTGFGSAAAAAQVQAAYSGGEVASAGGFVRNFGALLGSLPLLLAGEIGERRGMVEAADGPVAVVYTALTLLGLVVVSWRRLALPALLTVSAALVLPVVNGKYEPLFNGRYLGPLLPLGFALTVVGVLTLIDGLRWRGGRTVQVGQPGRASRLRSILAVCVVALLAVPPLLSLHGYIVATMRDGPNNRELYRAVEVVLTANPSRPVLVESTLSGTRLSTGREGTGVLEYLLILDARVPIRRLPPEELLRAAERGEADLVIVSPRLFARLDKDHHSELPAGEADARRQRRAGFWITRLTGPV